MSREEPSFPAEGPLGHGGAQFSIHTQVDRSTSLLCFPSCLSRKKYRIFAGGVLRFERPAVFSLLGVDVLALTSDFSFSMTR